MSQGSDDWRSWHTGQWSERLLTHYFSAHESVEPVKNLVVLSPEFADITGDSETPPAEIVESFIQKIQATIGDSNIWDVALKRVDDFGGPKEALPFLLFSCVVAVNIEEDEPKSFLNRFDRQTNGGEHRIEEMAGLWSRLSAWLEGQPAYRSLELPDPRSWTRIGHTVRLAFPSNRSQRQLCEVLEKAELLLDDPPLGPVLSAVIGSRGNFPIAFQEHLDDFQELAATRPPLQALYETPFWNAVLRAVTSDKVSPSRKESRTCSLVADDDGYDEFDLRIVSQDEALPGVELFEGAGDHDWQFETTSADALAVLTTQSRIPSLSSIVQGGVLPFVDAGGIYELAPRQLIREAKVALVTQEALQSFEGIFGGTASVFLEAEGWFVVRGAQMTLLPLSELRDTVFERTWILHEAPHRRTIRFVGGIRLEHGYLGLPGRLPRVRADRSLAAIVSVGGEVLELDKPNGDFVFTDSVLTSRYEGEVTVSVDFEDGPTRERKLRLGGAPYQEKYRKPSDLAPWSIEWLGQSEKHFLRERPSEPPLIAGVEDVLYLGLRIGEFLPSAEGAAWHVYREGETQIGQCVVDDPMPTERVDDRSARRKWRKLLNSATWPDASHKAFASAASKVRDGDVKEATFKPNFEKTTASYTDHDRLDEVINVLAARANNRVGIGLKVVLDEIEHTLGVVGQRKFEVLRSWMETGAIDVAATSRFWNRQVFARPPLIEVFRTEKSVRARLSGLVLPSTRHQIRQLADELRLPWADQPSEMGLTPSCTTFVGQSLDDIELLGQRAGISVAALDELAPQASASDCRQRLPNHQPDREWPFCNVKKWRAPKSPTYWEAFKGDQSLYFLHPELAEFAAAALNDNPAVSFDGTSIIRENAYLPLPIARRLNTLSTRLSGPGSSHLYSYFSPTQAISAWVEDQVSLVVQQLEISATLEQS